MLMPERPAVVQAECALGPAGELLVVGHVQHGQAALAGGGEDELHDLGRGGGVELPDDLVGEQQVWLVGQRHGDRHPLRLSAGQLAGRMIHPVLEPELGQAARRARAEERRRGEPMASSTFSTAVRNGMRLSDWRTMPIRSARRRARPASSSWSVCCPPMLTWPASGRISPAIRESRVDLPLPDRPTRLVVSPAARSRSTWSST